MNTLNFAEFYKNKVEISRALFPRLQRTLQCSVSKSPLQAEFYKLSTRAVVVAMTALVAYNIMG